MEAAAVKYHMEQQSATRIWPAARAVWYIEIVTFSSYVEISAAMTLRPGLFITQIEMLMFQLRTRSGIIPEGQVLLTWQLMIGNQNTTANASTLNKVISYNRVAYPNPKMRWNLGLQNQTGRIGPTTPTGVLRNPNFRLFFGQSSREIHLWYCCTASFYTAVLKPQAGSRPDCAPEIKHIVSFVEYNRFY